MGNLFLNSLRKETFLITCIKCTSIKNASTLPSFLYRANTRIQGFNISEKDILRIIKSLDSTKAHGYGNLSIKMIQICNEVIDTPLKLFFEQSLKNGIFL